MRRKHKASDIDKHVFDSISDLREGNEFKLNTLGLLASVSVFFDIAAFHPFSFETTYPGEG